MRHVDGWLDDRAPAPPGVLLDDVRSGLDASADEACLVDRLTEAALVRLSHARERPGRVRASAFDLLAADALVTYACEAALEVDDPDTVLTDMLRILAAS